MPETASPSANPVSIYIRLGRTDGEQDASVRDISFRIPEAINPMELLIAGFAIDGRNAAFTIAWDAHGEAWDAPFGIVAPSLNRALADTQRTLVEYLREKGFDPQFA